MPAQWEGYCTNSPAAWLLREESFRAGPRTDEYADICLLLLTTWTPSHPVSPRNGAPRNVGIKSPAIGQDPSCAFEIHGYRIRDSSRVPLQRILEFIKTTGFNSQAASDNLVNALEKGNTRQ